MKWTILGKSGGFPAPGGATSGYLLQHENRNILVDCGSGVLANLFRYIDIESLDAVIITHLHYDHISDLQLLRYTVDLNRRHERPVKAIPVFAPASPEPVASLLLTDESLVMGQVTDGTELDMFGINVRFSLMEHPVESYAVSFENNNRKIVYSGDTIPCDNLRLILKDADLAVLDAGSLERYRKPVMAHMTAAECGELAKAAGVHKLVLSHLLPLYDEQEILNEGRTIFAEAVLAENGDSYEI
ncbi:MAG: MBL fold metallo-hydrolase [Ruminococcaceae bacterium]|nr:MBL fold metallo-hydrolase [Oscillospiraceae bacterium]